jgi:hypothetical protein
MIATGRAFTAPAPGAALDIARDLAVPGRCGAARTGCLSWPQLTASVLGAG